MKQPWQRDFDSFIHSVPTWGKLGQKEQYHNLHCSLLTCMLDACERASHWRHQYDQDTLSVFPECTFYVGRQKDKPPSGTEQGIRGCPECWGHSRGTQELSKMGLLCELGPADSCRPAPGEWSLVFQAEDTACVNAQRSQRAWQYDTNRTCRISSPEDITEQADIPVQLDTGFSVAASAGDPPSSHLPLLP